MILAGLVLLAAVSCSNESDVTVVENQTKTAPVRVHVNDFSVSMSEISGSHFYENVSKDLKHALGLQRGLSPTTIKYTHYFYRLYSQLLVNRQQDAEEFAIQNRQGVIDDSLPANRQGVIDDFDSIFEIPWSLHILIIDKVKNDPNKALFYVKKTIENNWGYGVLLNFLSTDLYERQGASQTNFALTMPFQA